jgi:hypothetical protein
MNKMFEHAQLRITNAHVIDNCRISIIKFYTWKTLCRILLLIKQTIHSHSTLSLSHLFLWVLTCWTDNDYWILLCLLACWSNTITSTTRLYASIQIGFFHCCYSALKQIQSISFSHSHRQLCNKQREKEKYSLMFIYSSFLFSLSFPICVCICVCSSQSFDCMHAIDNDDVD